MGRMGRLFKSAGTAGRGRRSGWLVGVLAILGLVGLAAPRAEASQSFVVTEWDPAQWAVTSVAADRWVGSDATDGNGGASSLTSGSGGPTGDYWVMHNRVNSWSPAGLDGNTSTNTGRYLYTGVTYNPSAQGAIKAVRLSIACSSLGQGVYLLLRQDGKIYYSTNGYVSSGPGGWYAVRVTAVSSQFGEGGAGGRLIAHPDSHPDFSASGGPIEFGFAGSNTTGAFGGGYDTSVAYDTLSVDICPEGSILVQDWDTSRWSTKDQLLGTGGTATFWHTSEGGIGNGDYAVVDNWVNAWNPGDPDTHSGINGMRVYSAETYDPALRGALDQVTFSIDAGTNTYPFYQSFNFAVRQNNRWYLVWGAGTPPGWNSLSVTVHAGDFVEVDEHFHVFSSNHPDFSAAGAPIEFGFATGNANSPPPGNGSYGTRAVFDNFLVCVDAAAPTDTTPPVCSMGAVVSVGGIVYLPVTVSDSGTGVAAVQLTTRSYNCRLEWDGPGGLVTANIGGTITMSPTAAITTVRVVKLNSAQKARVELRVTDGAGNDVVCDPVIANLELKQGRRLSRSFKGIPEHEHYVTLQNGAPGLAAVKLWVNGHLVSSGSLTDGQVVTLDVRQWMRRGKNNTVQISATGPLGGTAVLLIGDASLAGGSVRRKVNGEFSR